MYLRIKNMKKKKKKRRRKKIVSQQKLIILRERERERELVFKPTTKKNLVLFVVAKLYIKYRNLKDGLYLKKYNSS